MNKRLMHFSATSWTALSFFVIALSGIMMFFHFYDDYVGDLHEWIGLFFIAAVFLHVFYNFKSMKNYFGKKIFLVSSVVLMSVTTLFIMNAMDKKENPKKIIIKAVLKAPLESSTQLLGIDFFLGQEKLKLKGLVVKNTQESLEDIAKRNHISAFKIVNILLEK